MIPDAGSNIVLAQITSSAVIAYGLEMLKKWNKIPWINQNTKRINRIVSAILSGVAALGIHMQFNSEAGTLMITGLCLPCIVHGMWDWARSWVVTQLVYDGAIAKNGNGAAKQA